MTPLNVSRLRPKFFTIDLLEPSKQTWAKFHVLFQIVQQQNRFNATLGPVIQLEIDKPGIDGIKNYPITLLKLICKFDSLKRGAKPFRQLARPSTCKKMSKFA